MPLAAQTENASRNDGDIVLLEKLGGKFLARNPEIFDAREHIERARRLRNFKPHVAECLVHEISPLLVRNSHFFHIFPAVPQALDCRVLAENRGADCVVAVKLYDLREDFGGGGNIADSPARHRERF